MSSVEISRYFENIVFTEHRRHVHLRTLSTNDPHPLARNAAVLVNIPDVPGLGEDSEDTHARIFGDYLALQYIIFHENDRTHFYTFTLLRWKTSETIHVRI